jgi:hypothetical protein
VALRPRLSPGVPLSYGECYSGELYRIRQERTFFPSVHPLISKYRIE